MSDQERKAERESSDLSFLIIHDFLVEHLAGRNGCRSLAGPEDYVGVIEVLGSPCIVRAPPVLGIAGCSISTADSQAKVTQNDLDAQFVGFGKLLPKAVGQLLELLLGILGEEGNVIVDTYLRVLAQVTLLETPEHRSLLTILQRHSENLGGALLAGRRSEFDDGEMVGRDLGCPPTQLNAVGDEKPYVLLRLVGSDDDRVPNLGNISLLLRDDLTLHLPLKG